MQETLLKQWQDLNQISLDWYRDTSESQAAAINDWMGLQSAPGAWAKLAKSTALFKTQAGILSLYTDTTAQYLDLLKQAKSVEDLIATQAHLLTGVQDKLKTYSLDCLQIAGSVKSALAAWAEKAVDTATAEDERPASGSAPRRIPKKTDPSA